MREHWKHRRRVMEENKLSHLSSVPPEERARWTAAVRRVMSEYPDLTAVGWRPWGAPAREFEQHRAEMTTPDFMHQVALAAMWIDAGYMNKYLRSGSSYGMKHPCQRWAGRFISNGAFIVAALLRGFRCHWDGYHQQLNCSFYRAPTTKDRA